MNGLWVAAAAARNGGAAIGGLAFVGLSAGDELHLDRDFDLEYIDAVLLLAELGHGAGDDVGLGLGVGDGLFVAALVVIADELEEEGDVVGAALVTDALDEGVLAVVDLGLLHRRVIEEDLDTVGAGFLEPTDRPVVEQIGEAPGGGGVVAGLLIGEQEALAVAMFGGGKSELGIEEDGGGVLGEHRGDEGLELFERTGWNRGGAGFLRERLLEGAALIHGGGGDDAAVVRDSIEARELAGCELDLGHDASPGADVLSGKRTRHHSTDLGPRAW